MSVRSLGNRLVFTSMFALSAGACGGGSVDGKYYNAASGEFAMELKDGKVVSMQGMDGAAMTYNVKGDSVVIHGPKGGLVDQMALHIEKNGDLSLGILGTLTKTRK